MLFCARKYPIVGPEFSAGGAAIIEGIILFVIAATLLHWPTACPHQNKSKIIRYKQSYIILLRHATTNLQGKIFLPNSNTKLTFIAMEHL